MSIKYTYALVLSTLMLTTISTIKPLLSPWTINEISPGIAKMMIGRSYHSSCPIGLDDLRYVIVLHLGFDDEEHRGTLVVHEQLAQEVIDIFKELYEHNFLIEKIHLIDRYDANDIESMEDNNTSAFCYRERVGKPGEISMHSYGAAIDINPLINPYVKGKVVLPRMGMLYLNPSPDIPGKITKDSMCYKIFKKYGWTSGLDFEGYIDGHHFEKDIFAEESN